MSSRHLLLLFLLSSAAVVSAIARCLPAHSSALLRLKHRFSSPALPSWVAGTDCCVWDGVTCAGGVVTILDLSNRFISGELDESLFNLTDLVSLNLAYNEFDQNPFPRGFERLEKLTALNLSNSGFVGQVPAGISRLSRLESLDLSSLSFIEGSGFFLSLRDPDLKTLVSDMGNLRELVLDGMDVSSNGDDWCQAIARSAPGLETLSMVHCSITGPIDGSLSSLRSLSVLRLDNNKLNSTVPEFFGNFSSLTGLYLNSCGLKGSFPESVFRLRDLSFLDASDNPMLSGSLPEFTEDSSIQSLVLSNTKFSGSLPESIGRLKSLSKLDLVNCFFTGPIPDSNLTRLSGLTDLSLSFNKFTGTLDLDSFLKLKNLSILDLSNNLLSIIEVGDGEFSPSLITSLNLSSCNLTRIPGFLKHRTGMSQLDLSNNRIAGVIPKWIWGVGNSNQLSLNLSHNLFTDIERPWPGGGNFSSIIVDLHSNMLRGSIPLLPLTNVLDYSDNLFSSFIPSNISSYLGEFFSVSNNHLMGEIPPSICNATVLLVLDLSGNHFNGPIPPCIMENMTSLIVLNLKGNEFSGSIPGNVNRQCTLQTLNLNGNRLEGRVPETLANCAFFLQVLDLGNNRIVDAFPFWLRDAAQLRVLVLRGNGFYGPISNCTLPTLQVLDLASNRFNGSLSAQYIANLKEMMVNSPYNIPDLGWYDDWPLVSYKDIVTVTFKGLEMDLVKTLTVFKSIDLSNNGFHGDIPEEIGRLSSLYMLNLSHNSFTGSMPLSLGDMVQLESLDLSSNHLTGEIPAVLAKMTFLEFLNLSSNDLVGKIPQGNQFTTFTEDSFEGNAGLCGRPLSKHCGGPEITAPPPKPKPTPGREPNWQHIFEGLGFVVGLATVMVYQLVYHVWGKGRRW